MNVYNLQTLKKQTYIQLPNLLKCAFLNAVKSLHVKMFCAHITWGEKKKKKPEYRL